MQQTFDLVEGEVFQEKKMTVKSYDWPRRQAPEFAGYEVREADKPPIAPAKIDKGDTKAPQSGCLISMEAIWKVGT